MLDNTIGEIAIFYNGSTTLNHVKKTQVWTKTGILFDIIMRNHFSWIVKEKYTSHLQKNFSFGLKASVLKREKTKKKKRFLFNNFDIVMQEVTKVFLRISKPVISYQSLILPKLNY